MLCCDHVGASQHQFVTATQCGAIDRRDHGFTELLQCSKCSLCRVWRRACRLKITGFADLQQFLHVGTRNKGTAGASNHHCVHIILMLKLLHNGVKLVEGALVERVDRWMVDHQKCDLVVIVQAVGFDPQVTPGLNNLSRLSQSAKVAPPSDRALNLFHRLGVSECGQIAQWLVEQDGAQRAAHVLARAGFGEGRDHQEVRGYRGGAFFGAHQILQPRKILIGKLAACCSH